MKTEIEAKFFPIDKAAVRERLREVGATLVVPDRLMRRVVFNRRKNPQLLCTYARVRDEGDAVRMSLKTNAEPGGKVTDQKELDFVIENFETGRDFLLGLGLVATGYHENLRETWQLGDSEIVLDTWPALPPYAEIETSSVERLEETAKLLRFDWERKVVASNTHIYAMVYGITPERATELLAHSTFERHDFGTLEAVAQWRALADAARRFSLSNALGTP